MYQIYWQQWNIFLYMYVDLSILMSWLQISSFKKDSITIVTYISTWKIENNIYQNWFTPL